MQVFYFILFYFTCTAGLTEVYVLLAVGLGIRKSMGKGLLCAVESRDRMIVQYFTVTRAWLVRHDASV